LTEVLLQGNTALPASAFADLIARYRDREVTISELQELAQAIEHAYRSQGYVTTIVFLPPQQIQAGRVTIQVLEGRVGQVLVEGNRYFSVSRILWHWPLTSGAVLNYHAMRRALVRMNAQPDRQVQALLRAGAATGETDVILKVQDRAPLHAGAQWDRQGTKSIGRLRYGFSVGHNNLLGRDDRAIVGGVFGKDFGAVSSQYVVPLTPHGTTAVAGFSHSQSSPKRQFKASGVNGTSQTFWVAVSQPLIEEQAASLQAEVRFDVKESRSKQLGGTSQRDRLRAIRFGPTLRLTDAWGGWTAEHQYAFGIKGLGATSEHNPVASRPGSKPNFVTVGFQLNRLQRLPWQTYASLNLEAQVSPSKLAPQEELFLGGADSVRGYPEGDYLADQGLIARLEYLVPCNFLPAGWTLPAVEEPVREQVTLLGFFDRGYGRLRAITGDERATRNLAGLGLGVQVRVGRSIFARVEWGFHVGDRPLTDDSPSTLHFSIRSDL